MATKIFSFALCMKASKSSSKKGSPVTDSSSSTLFREEKPSPMSRPLLKKRKAKVSDMQQKLSQLQEELKKEKEEKSQAREELAEVKKKIDPQGYVSQSKSKIEALEKELETTKQSETKMLETLRSQTKSLEETKMNLEEARLEIRSLKENNKSLVNFKASPSWSSRNLGRYLLQTSLPGKFHAEEDTVFTNELNLSGKEEENSRKALDDLAMALKKVTTEANQLRERLSITQSELDKVRSEAEISKTLLEDMEGKYQVTLQEYEKLKLELDEATTAWNQKEIAFISCIKMSDEETTKAKVENDKLFESQRVIREENVRLRDMLKNAVAEASVVKEHLEIARKDNSHLKDLLSEKEDKLQSIKQEYEFLKISEAAAIDSVRELKSLLAAPFSA